MKTSKYTKKELVELLKNSNYKETAKNFWEKTINRVNYSYTLKNWGYSYLEREESLKEGWWSEDWKYKD